MYTVSNVKQFFGREGYGFRCSLDKDGVKVADVEDGGDGASYDFYWEAKKEATLFDKHLTTLPELDMSEYGLDETLPINRDMAVGNMIDQYFDTRS